MNNKYLILILIVFIGCNKSSEKIKPQKIDLINNLDNLTRSISENDTIELTMNLSLCVYQGLEKHKIIKSGDSLIFNGQLTEFDNETTNYKEVKLSLKDTNLTLNSFLKNNKFRAKNCLDRGAKLSIKSDTSSVYFFSKGLGDSSEFIIEYLDMICKIYPDRQNRFKNLIPPPPPPDIEIKYRTED